MDPISRDDLQAPLAAGAVTLVEALPESHFDAEHLPGAVNLPGELTADLAATLAPDRTRKMVTYCPGPSCGRSEVAAAAFSRLGYPDVRVYTDGKADWAGAGLPFERTRALPKAA
ncbi:rhodanese-like domain-containing protein [Micromonospora sp. NPDC049374]|uniref:rhodanese-like domain-containing protein n=1 Tax=Micromonospora sp. NPDC049374 TaxID=3154352 RepID=UPI003443B5E0